MINNHIETDWEPCSQAEELALWLFMLSLFGLLVTIGSLIRDLLSGA